jgi:hypothetical protein
MSSNDAQLNERSLVAKNYGKEEESSKEEKGC